MGFEPRAVGPLHTHPPHPHPTHTLEQPPCVRSLPGSRSAKQLFGSDTNQAPGLAEQCARSMRGVGEGSRRAAFRLEETATWQVLISGERVRPIQKLRNCWHPRLGSAAFEMLASVFLLLPNPAMNSNPDPWEVGLDRE